MKRLCIIAAVAVAAAIAGAGAYGYWHAATHATFEVQLVYRTGAGMVNRMRNGQLAFVDDEGRVLARASIDVRRGVVWLSHPEKGQCGPVLLHETRDDCFRAQTEWIPLWAHRVRHANIALENCSQSNVPVNLYTRRDNTVAWWTPLTARRGLPYTRHKATLTMNQGCG